MDTPTVYDETPIIDEAAVQGYTDTVTVDDLAGLNDTYEVAPEVEMYEPGTLATPDLTYDTWDTLGTQTESGTYINSLSTATDAEAAPVEGHVSADDYLASLNLEGSEPVVVEEPVVIESTSIVEE